MATQRTCSIKTNYWTCPITWMETLPPQQQQNDTASRVHAVFLLQIPQLFQNFSYHFPNQLHKQIEHSHSKLNKFSIFLYQLSFDLAGLFFFKSPCCRLHPDHYHEILEFSRHLHFFLQTLQTLHTCKLQVCLLQSRPRPERRGH